MRLIFGTRKLKIGLAVVIGVLTITLSAVYLFVIRPNSNSNQDSTGLTGESTPEQVIEQANRYFSQEERRIAELANDIETPEELKKISDTDRANVGLAIIEASQDENPQKANLFIDYFMQQEDAMALDVSVLCYQLANSDERKAQCLTRMNELARILEIIGPNDSLPSSYYEGGV